MTEQSKQSLDETFENWWYNEGGGIIPLPGNDYEEHGYRISRIAWHNGAYAALNALGSRKAALSEFFDIKIAEKRIVCPKHGTHNQFIVSNIAGHEGHWCMLCWLESLGPSLPLVDHYDG